MIRTSPTQAAKLGDEELRLAAVWALAQFHEPEVLPILLSEADRPHPIIQSFLANTLGTFQDSRVVPALCNPEIRAFCTSTNVRKVLRY